MGTLGQDARYRALATAAAAELGTSSPSIIAAILGQWQCEQPGGPPWPPVHNNPGFVTIGAIRSVNVTLGTAAKTSPGINFLAAFGSPGEGASAYAQLLARGKRYAGVRAAVAAGDGAAYLQAVTSAAYGTRYSCAIGAYKALGGSVAPSTGGGSLELANLLPPGTTRESLKAAMAAAGVSSADDHRLTQADADALAKALNWPNATALKGVVNGLVYQALGQPNSFVPGFTEAANKTIEQATASVGAAIGEAIGQGVFSLLVLGGIVVLGLMGIRRLTG